MSRTILSASILFTTTMILAGCDLQTETFNYKPTGSLAPVKIVTNLDIGDVEVRPTTASGTVSIVAEAQWAAKKPSVKFSQTGTTLYVTADCAEEDIACRVDLSLTVPPQVALDIRAEESNIAVSGLDGDATLNTGVPGVYAAGDCARWPNGVFAGFDDEEMRVEHWTNAAEQGAAAARNLLAVARGEAPEPYASVPFFWSDQFDSRIQFVGRAHGGDDVHVFAGNTDGAFAALYGYEGRLRGVLGVSMPRMVMPFRALLSAGATWDEALEKAAALTAG